MEREEPISLTESISEAQALEVVKQLLKQGADFLCEKLDMNAWKVTVLKEGRAFADSDAAGQPSERLDTDLLGKVIAAREARKVTVR